MNTKEWVTCMNDSSKKYCTEPSTIGGSGYCCGISDTSTECSGTSYRWSDENVFLPNTAKFLLCPFYYTSYNCGSSSFIVTVNKEVSGEISTRLLDTNDIWYFKLVIQDGELFDIETLSTVNGYAYLYYSEGSHNYTYVYRLWHGTSVTLTNDKQGSYYIVIEQSAPGTAAILINSYDEESEFPWPILVGVLVTIIVWLLCGIAIVIIIKKYRRHKGTNYFIIYYRTCPYCETGDYWWNTTWSY